MSIVVVDSGGANISSVLHALRRQGVDPVFSADAGTIRAAGRVILPGVGAAGQAARADADQVVRTGIDDPLAPAGQVNIDKLRSIDFRLVWWPEASRQAG